MILINTPATANLIAMEISSETAGNAIISDAILASRGMVQEGVLRAMR